MNLFAPPNTTCQPRSFPIPALGALLGILLVLTAVRAWAGAPAPEAGSPSDGDARASHKRLDREAELAELAKLPDTLVIPGVRVGPVMLGETIESVTKKLGAGQIFRSKDYTNLLYPGFTVVVNNVGKQTVHAIVVTDPPYHLKNGIGCGTSETTVTKLLGKASTVQLMKGQTNGMIDKSIGYQKLGLTVAFARSKVVQIGIYQRSTH